MLNFKILFLVILLGSSHFVWGNSRVEFFQNFSATEEVSSSTKVVFGEDDREDPFALRNQSYLEYGESVAAMISPEHLQKVDKEGNSFKVVGKPLYKKNICESERFAKQLSVAECSGFLVGNDIIATAGHCARDLADCQSYNWVFNFHMENSEELKAINKNDIYSCTHIIARKYDSRRKDDWALIKLDRPVLGRSPLKLRQAGKINRDASLLLIGHPSGLPQKYTTSKGLRKNRKRHFFVTSLDTFGGNSGSPVINTQEGIVEGILVRGDKDYKLDRRARCSKVRVCRERGCKGADVTRISELPL